VAGSEEQGVYCLANDGVYEWFVPFADSLRRHDPELPVMVIPYDDRMDGIARLSEQFAFDVFDSPHLATLDAIGSRLYPARAHRYRKLAAFLGPITHFCFADTDIVFLAPLAPLIDTYRASGLDLVYAGANLSQVYRDERFREHMAATYGSAGFNSGLFLSSTGRLDLAVLHSATDEAEPLVDRFAASDQSFLNFIADTQGWRTGGLTDVDGSVSSSVWADQALVERDGRYHPMVDGREDRGVYVPAIHWAGFHPGPRMPNADLYLRHRLAAMGPIDRLRFRAVTWPWTAMRPRLASLARRLRRR
jgi:hypothetical protein